MFDDTLSKVWQLAERRKRYIQAAEGTQKTIRSMLPAATIDTMLENGIIDSIQYLSLLIVGGMSPDLAQDRLRKLLHSSQNTMIKNTGEEPTEQAVPFPIAINKVKMKYAKQPMLPSHSVKTPRPKDAPTPYESLMKAEAAENITEN